MQRFYYQDISPNTQSLILKDKDMIHQLIKVLRVTTGTHVALFDGIYPYDIIYEITEIEKKSISLLLKEKKANKTESELSVHIYQALPNKKEKIEHVLQKGVEVGVKGFCFFSSERSQKIYISENNITRFHRIMIEASEQSGRSLLPSLSFHHDIVPKIPKNSFFLHTGNTAYAQKIQDIHFHKLDDISLFVGPEGGFSESEIEYFLEQGAKQLYLGPRILRTETAPVVAAFACIQKSI